jgi:hypothetical protein
VALKPFAPLPILTFFSIYYHFGNCEVNLVTYNWRDEECKEDLSCAGELYFTMQRKGRFSSDTVFSFNEKGIQASSGVGGEDGASVTFDCLPFESVDNKKYIQFSQSVSNENSLALVLVSLLSVMFKMSLAGRCKDWIP